MKRYKPHKYAVVAWCIRIVLPALFLLFLTAKIGAEKQFIPYIAAASVVLCIYAAAWCKMCEYCIGDGMLKAVCGILVRSETVIPVNRVQYAVYFQLPIQRLFGAASAVVMAAGGKVILFDIDCQDAKDIVQRVGAVQR